MQEFQLTQHDTYVFPTATSIRMLISMLAGAGVTFGLFAMMHAMIKQESTPVQEIPPINLVSSILEIDDPKLIIKPKPMPMPKQHAMPKSQTQLPETPNDNSTFSKTIKLPSMQIDKLSYDIGAIDQQPRPLVRVNPSYPGPAATKGIEGFVKLSFSVSPTGEVIDINIIEAEPKNVFERSAKKALRKWRYQPKLVSGVPVGMEGLQVRLDFNLSNN